MNESQTQKQQQKKQGQKSGGGVRRGHPLATQISLQANSLAPSSVCLKSLLFIDWV